MKYVPVRSSAVLQLSLSVGQTVFSDCDIVPKRGERFSSGELHVQLALAILLRLDYAAFLPLAKAGYGVSWLGYKPLDEVWQTPDSRGRLNTIATRQTATLK